MDAEGSQAVQRAKRPARVLLSDDEEEDGSPILPNGVAANGKRRKSVHREMEEELEELTDEEEEEGRDRKPRMNGHGEDDEDEAVDVGVKEGQVGVIGFRPEYQRGKDGYVAGSITRIKLTNFMTYDHVEFRPGPHLNMILGPNGTGKSTIAAGIAIGLGFAPKVMGRAHDLKSYVKQGMEEAQTEVELKARPGQRNPVIWRRFTREDDKSEWRLNNQNSTKKAVAELVEGFGVQANNLWLVPMLQSGLDIDHNSSFLPQDKVAEFAKMAPDVVLKETMRAAGDPRLTAWHEALCEKGEIRKKLESTFDVNNNQRTHLQAQLDRIAPDVEIIQNRKELEQQREILQVEKLVAEREAVMASLNALKEQRFALKDEEKAKDRKRRPLLDLHDKFDRIAKKAEVRQTKNEDDIKEVGNRWKSQMRKLNDAERQSVQLDEDLGSIKRRAKKREDTAKQYKSRIRQAEEILDQPVENVEAQAKEVTQRRRSARAALDVAVDETTKYQEEAKSCEQELNTLNKEIRARTTTQQRLSSVEEQREMIARDFDPSISWMLDWLKQHEHELEGPVSRPPMMSVNIRDMRYAWMVEASTNLPQRRTFICTSKKDYDRLMSELQGKQVGDVQHPDLKKGAGQFKISRNHQLRLNLTYVEVNDTTCNPPRPCSPEKLAQSGMDCWAIDQVEAEPAVIAFLNVKASLHKIPLTLRPGKDVDPDRIFQELKVNSLVNSTDSVSANRANYGAQDRQTTTRSRSAAKAFAVTVDHEAIRNIADEIADMKRKMRELERPSEEAKTKAESSRKKAEAAKAEVKKCDGEIEELKTKREKHVKAKIEKEINEKRLAQLEAEPSQEKEREKLQSQKYKILRDIMPNLQSYWAAGEDTIDISTSVCSNALVSAQTQVDLAAITEYISTGDEAVEQVRTEISEVTDQIKAATVRGRIMYEDLQAMMSDKSSAVKELLKARFEEKRSLETVRDELADVVNTLELSVQLDDGIVDRHKRLSAQLEEISEKVDNQERDLNIVKKQINKILAGFDPALNTLVDVVSKKFSAAFERVGCSGEVRISRSEDSFANWGIEIMVSYRDGVDLDLLTGSRQSGGERSLATVTYLMSLSEMARTPFSLVDEINQGMDQKAERNVHNQLVEVTCGADAGQYFLITPKLLTNLSYHRKMKTLIVNNGTWLPDTMDKRQRWGDLRSCLDRYKAQHVTAH